MKYFLLCWALLVVVVAKEKKISLEDIEQNNLNKKVPPVVPSNSPTNFGFVPTRTASEYARQPQQEYVPAPQQYVYENAIPQYYTPQYVYLQPYPAPSTAIQTIVDPKSAIQYVMYIPQQAHQNVVYTTPQGYEVPDAQPEQPQYFSKQEPKSLLDSYVPSYLQIQYYKQQQAQANSIRQNLKDSSQVSTKTSYRPDEYTYQVPANNH